MEPPARDPRWNLQMDPFATHTPGHDNPNFGATGMDDNPNQHSVFKANKNRDSTFVNTWELVLLPWVLLCFVLISFMFEGNSMSLLLVPLVLIIVDVGFMRWRLKKGHHAEVVLGLLCLAAIIAGTAVGFYVNVSALSEYWRLQSGASYFNVYPAESAAAYQDATTMQFSLDTGVDSGRTYGFVDGRTLASTLYCVAPVASSATSAVTNHIQYWAAGIGCCYPRSDFVCGDAKKAEARGAVVLPQSTQKNEMFKAAVQGAQFAYGIAPADKYLLVEWKADPIKYAKGLWTNSCKLVLIFGGVYLLISVLVGTVLATVLNPAKHY